MKKCLLVLALFSFILLYSSFVLASNSIEATLNKEYTIIFNDEEKSFYNAKGEEVFAILYDSTKHISS